MKKLSLAAAVAAVIASSCAPPELFQYGAAERHAEARRRQDYHTLAWDSAEEIAPENFDEKILDNRLPSAVYFYSPYCAPCANLTPIYNKLCSEFQGRMYCGAYDVEQEEGMINPTSRRYGVDGVPALRFFCRGNEDEQGRIDKGWTEETLRHEFRRFLESCR